ncbi:hypothetical protein CGRA01v4_00272 [Colletotrichum graminicola]|nr:hypothetical protein CGRA01v4_00272 [Colletotrichum graminicola]
MGPCLWDRVLMFLQLLAEIASIPVRSGTGVDKVALPTELRWPVNGLRETLNKVGHGGRRRRRQPAGHDLQPLRFMAIGTGKQSCMV